MYMQTIVFNGMEQSDVMEDWMYEKFEKYALDKDMQDWFNQVNPEHCSVLLQFLLKQSKEIYGTLSRKQKLNCKNYLSMEGELEELSDKISE